MKPRRLAHIIAFSCLGLLSLNAASEWYVNPGVGYLNFDNDLNLGDVNFPTIGLEYLSPTGFAVEGAYLFSTADSEVSSAEFDYDQFHLDGLKYFPFENGLSPYLAIGIGEGSLDSDAVSVSETVTNAGFGMRYAVSKPLSLRGDVRGFWGNDESDFNYAVTFTLAYRFGVSEKAKPEPVIEAAKEPEEEPEEEMTLADVDVPEEPTIVVLDDDADGVNNDTDKCPNTPTDTKVNEVGCPLLKTETVSIKLDVKFPVNQAELQTKDYGQLKELASFMDQYPKTTAVIEGHSDSLGDAGYNKNLSQRRADNIRKILVEQYLIAPDRLKAIGYGEERPIADNSTKEGREANRRVVANISTQIKTVEKKYP